MQYGHATRRYFPVRAAACAWIAALAPLAQPVLAADLQVSPVSLHFAPAEQARSLWILNAGHEPVQVQVRVQGWTQAGGADVLGPTREIVASPPLVAVAPGQRQLVRIVRPVPAAPDKERSYRVLVDELPVAVPAADASPAARSQGLRLLLRYSLPVFVAPAGASAGLAGPTDLGTLRFGWAASSRLRVENIGARRVRISALEHEDASGRRTQLVPGLLGYVLSGNTMEWDIPRKQALGPGTLKARLNDDPIEQELPIPRGL